MCITCTKAGCLWSTYHTSKKTFHEDKNVAKTDVNLVVGVLLVVKAVGWCGDEGNKARHKPIESGLPPINYVRLMPNQYGVYSHWRPMLHCMPSNLEEMVSHRAVMQPLTETWQPLDAPLPTFRRPKQAHSVENRPFVLRDSSLAKQQCEFIRNLPPRVWRSAFVRCQT